MKTDGSLARNIDFEVANFQVLRRTRRKTPILKLQSVKIGGSQAQNARFDAPTCLVSSLWLSCGLAVSMGEAAKPVLFEGFQAGCHVVLRGRRSTSDVTCRVACSTLHPLHFTLRTTSHFTLHSTHYTPHSTLYPMHTPHFTLHTPCITLRTPPRSTLYTLHTLHSTPCTPQFLLYTPHSTFHTTLSTPHSPLHTLHSTLHTLHFTLYTLHLGPIFSPEKKSLAPL